MRTAGSLGTWSSPNSTWLWRKRVATTAFQVKQFAWIKRWELRPETVGFNNDYGTLALSFLLHSTYKFLPTPANPSRAARQELAPVQCASLWEGLCHMFFLPVGVHSRCTPGTITECSPYSLNWLKTSEEWLTSSFPKTQTHTSVSSKKKNPDPDMSANHRGKCSSQPWGTGSWQMTSKNLFTSHITWSIDFPHYIEHTQEQLTIMI